MLSWLSGLWPLENNSSHGFCAIFWNVQVAHKMLKCMDYMHMWMKMGLWPAALETCITQGNRKLNLSNKGQKLSPWEPHGLLSKSVGCPHFCWQYHFGGIWENIIFQRWEGSGKVMRGKENILIPCAIQIMRPLFAYPAKYKASLSFSLHRFPSSVCPCLWLWK